MKLKFLLWIVAAVAVVAACISIFVLRDKDTLNKDAEVVTESVTEAPAEQSVETTAAVSDAETALPQGEEVVVEESGSESPAVASQNAEVAPQGAATTNKTKSTQSATKRGVKKTSSKSAKRVASGSASAKSGVSSQPQVAVAAPAEAPSVVAETPETAAPVQSTAIPEQAQPTTAEKLSVPATTTDAFAENGLKGRVLSRGDRRAVGNVTVAIEGTNYATTTNDNGDFLLSGIPAGSYRLSFTAPEYEELDIVVKVERGVKDINGVIIIPKSMQGDVLDDAIFAEFDNDSSASDTQALPSSLSASKDLYNNIASYRFSEMRFNVRGYDSKYTDVYLNGIRFNDANTGYGPWSLWSGMNDATRNQESTAGLTATDYGIGGFGGTTNINARASQMRKGFRASVSGGNQMYNFRAIVSYASGMLDSGWSYAFSVSTRQGGNGYVDGVYYNSYGYFAAVEKQFNPQHRLSLMVLGTPQQRGAQQASTQEAYDMFGSNYYNPNVGFQDGKMRNTRVRRSHEPIVMLNYYYDINEKTRFTAATSVRFGFNGYSALTWKDGSDPRPDYYRFLPSNYTTQIITDANGFGSFLANNASALYEQGLLNEAAIAFKSGRTGVAIPGIFNPSSEDQIFSYLQAAADARSVWNGRIDFDNMINSNRNGSSSPYANGHRSNYMIEERHTDQIDYNFAANLSHSFNANNKLLAGVKARINRTEYYDKIKDLLGGDFWVDVDKFAERDMGSDPVKYQNDLDYYNEHGHARIVREGDKFSYDYFAHLRQAQAWLMYEFRAGGFDMNLGGEIGYAGIWREGLWRKGLFVDNSKGDSEHLNFLTYKVKGTFSYRFSQAHHLALNLAAIQDAPTFNSSFVSPRTRNTITPGLSPEQAYSAELVYNLNLPYLQARIAGYFTEMTNSSKVISFYDDTQASFTNFAMSNIDKRYMGVEVALRIPIWNGLALQGALNYGDYRYTSNPNFVQTVDNSNKVKLTDKVYWKGYYVESTPQFAVNVGLDFRGPKNWFASINFNYYDKLYLSMNPAYRTNNAVKPYVAVLSSENSSTQQRVWAAQQIATMRAEEELGSAYTLAASVGKNWYIRRKYTLGFSAEVKNILNSQGFRTGGYEQMRMRKVRGMLPGQTNPSTTYYTHFDSKYFYLLGTTCFVNVYFRF
ncbi:MAG: carboxypeptidase regulatory-like domain-containing protein [Alistipes sp.]|nr:carboxypeptidase regulatory-like domain-containing protein [Alistipes sp.]